MEEYSNRLTFNIEEHFLRTFSSDNNNDKKKTLVSSLLQGSGLRPSCAEGKTDLSLTPSCGPGNSVTVMNKVRPVKTYEARIEVINTTIIMKISRLREGVLTYP